MRPIIITERNVVFVLTTQVRQEYVSKSHSSNFDPNADPGTQREILSHHPQNS